MIAALALSAPPPMVEPDLPTHVAAADEPIPAPGQRMPEDGPDMRHVAPIDDMLAALQPFTDDQDDVGYVQRWREHLRAIGGSVLLHYARDGERDLTFGLPCDAQVRHRSRWAFYLFDDLEKQDGRRDVLMHVLRREHLFWDERRTDAAATTRAVRDFVRTGGRILITPEGELTEGGGMRRAFTHGTADEVEEVVRAGRVYFDVRRRLRADRQIKRAVRMLGRRTENGWFVLEARS